MYSSGSPAASFRGAAFSKNASGLLLLSVPEQEVGGKANHSDRQKLGQENKTFYPAWPKSKQPAMAVVYTYLILGIVKGRIQDGCSGDDRGRNENPSLSIVH
jgi:hypothetical protein